MRIQLRHLSHRDADAVGIEQAQVGEQMLFVMAGHHGGDALARRVAALKKIG